MRKKVLSFLIIVVSLLLGMDSILLSAEIPTSVEGKKSPSSTLSIREKMANFKYVAALISIDDYTTYVFPERSTIFRKRALGAGKEFTAELTSICDTRFEVLDTDPVTSQIKWVQWDGKQDIYKYWLKDKVTGRRIEYIGYSDKPGFEIPSRCKDRFDIKPNGWFAIDIMDRAFIYHKTPQPYVLKFFDLSDEQIYMPPDGEIQNMYWQKDESERNRIPFSFTLFAYFNALCRKLNGNNVKIRYITDNKEVSPLYLFEKVIEPYDRVKDWYLSCEGEKSFLLREIVYKDYSRTKSSANKKILFQSNRTAEDLLRDTANKSPKVTTVMSSYDIEDMVKEVASKKTTRIRTHGSQELIGIHNGRNAEGCDLVTVEKNWDVYMAKPRIDIHNFKVCDGVIMQATETQIEVVPKEMELFIQRIAKTAQRLGSAEGDFGNYTAKAVALRDKKQCLVEVKVFRGTELIKMMVVDGCS